MRKSGGLGIDLTSRKTVKDLTLFAATAVGYAALHVLTTSYKAENDPVGFKLVGIVLGWTALVGGHVVRCKVRQGAQD